MNQNGKNFKVFQASAGSGKTYTIIKEYLKLCLKSKNQVKNFQNILAITFTNASANDSLLSTPFRRPRLVTKLYTPPLPF